MRQFRALMLAELPALHRLSRHMTRGSAGADDLLQEVVLRALRASERFVLGESGIRPWLFQILYNTYRNLRRDQPRERLFDDFENDPKFAEEHSSTQRLSTLDWEQVDQEIYAAVQDLPDDYRAVFILFAVEGLPYKEIAQVLGIPVGTVMSRLARARRRLVAALPTFATGAAVQSSDPQEAR